MIQVYADIPEKLEFLFEPHRYKIVYGGRGSTKSWSCAGALALQGAKKSLRVVCAREIQKSLEESSHQLLQDSIKRYQLTSKYRITEKYIFGPRETQFSFHGLRHNVDSIKSLEGADIVWVDEAQNVSKDSWEKLIPTVRKPGSEIWISFNPGLESDDTWVRFILNTPPGAVVCRMNWQDNPWFPEELRIEKDHLQATDPRAYLHIWEGQPKSQAEGAIYEQEMIQAEEEGRLCQLPIDRMRPVDSYWDLGHGDTMAIWLVQQVGPWFHFVDYIENHLKPLSWYTTELQQRAMAAKYMAGTDWLPWDGVDAELHKNLGTDRTRSPEMLMRAAGRKVRLAPKMLVTSGINMARTMFPLCRFDKAKCLKGLDALRHYQWGPVAASGQERTTPLHDKFSHGADAYRTFAVTAKPQSAPKPYTPPAKPYGGTGPRSWMA